MPIPILIQGVREGVSSIPYAWPILQLTPWVLLVAALKFYFGGARNTSERLMHSKVVMVTGGTSGIGASVVHELASRGAQVILLTQHAPSDIFLIDYIEDVRRTTGNQLIYAEQVDLTSLHSIRTFATKWIDNVPPRRLDMLILCANTAAPSSTPSALRRVTTDGLDEEWQVNYLANFHLLSILSPALRAQPPHRDVRVIFTTCASYIGARLDLKLIDTAPVTDPSFYSSTASTPFANPTTTPNTTKKNKKTKKPAQDLPTTPRSRPSLFAASKLSLMIFAHAFQKHLNAYKRPDNQPPCTRVLVVDPGFSRTPGMRRWLTGGSLWGLLFYLLTWPFWWLVLKSPQQGAQSILYAAMEARYGRGEGGWMIKECREVDFARREIVDEKVAAQLWEFSEKQIEVMEREGALRRMMANNEAKAPEGQKGPGGEKGAGAGASSGTKDQTTGSRRSRRNK